MPATQTDRLFGLNTSVAVKAPVLAASTGNLTLELAQTVDGIAVSSCDRVLAKDQTTKTENGIYTVTGSTWERAADFTSVMDVVRGTLVYVVAGTASGDRWYGVTSKGNNTPGTNAVTFAETVVRNDLGQVLDANGNAINESEGSPIAPSGSTVIDIWAVDGNTVHLTSSTGKTISGLGTPPNAGAVRRVIFDSSYELVHDSTSQVLPSSANINTIKGDIGQFYADSLTQTRLANFEAADGRDFSAAETVSSAGDFMRNSGLTLISTASTSGATFVLSAPVPGSRKTVVSVSPATALSIDTSSTSILFAIGASSTDASGNSSTGISWNDPNLFGVLLNLRGITSSLWSVISDTNTFTTSTVVDDSFSFVTLLVHFDSTAPEDVSGSSLSLVTDVYVPDITNPKFGLGAMDSVNSQSWVGSTDSSAFSLGSTEFTVEGFGRASHSFSSNTEYVWASQYDTVKAWQVGYSPTNGFQVAYSTDGSGDTVISKAFVPTTGVYFHWAWSRFGDTGFLSIDGSGSTFDMSGDVIHDSSADFYIGKRALFATPLVWQGNIDETRITIGVSRYSTDFTPPIAAFGDSSG